MYALPQDTYNKAVECIRAIGERKDCPYFDLFIQDKNVLYKMRAYNFDMDYNTKEDAFKEIEFSIISMIDIKHPQKLNFNGAGKFSVYYDNVTIWDIMDHSTIRVNFSKGNNTYNYSKIVDKIVKIISARIHICDNITDYLEEKGVPYDQTANEIINDMYDCRMDYGELNYLENTMHVRLEDN